MGAEKQQWADESLRITHMHAAFCLEPNIQQAPRFYCYVASAPRSRKMPTKPVASLLLFAATDFRSHGLTRKKKINPSACKFCYVYTWTPREVLLGFVDFSKLSWAPATLL